AASGGGIARGYRPLYGPRHPARGSDRDAVVKIAVTGYASLDHVAMLDGAPGAGRTTTILARPADAWPRLGGSPAYAAMALVKAGVAEAVPVSWVGEDEAGAAYRAQLHAQGVSDKGIAAVAG